MPEVINETGTRHCASKDCHETDPAKFGKNKRRPDGLCIYCRDCANSLSQKYRSEHPERYRGYDRKKHREHKEEILERARKHYDKNQEQLVQKARVYRAKDIDGYRRAARDRRAKSPDKCRERERRYRQENPEKWLKALRRHNQKRGTDYKQIYSGIYIVLAAAAAKVKIGLYTNLAKRIKSLQTGCPEPIQLVANIERVVTRVDEIVIHNRFSHLRSVGEWFNLDPELLSFIRNSATAVYPLLEELEQRAGSRLS